MSRNIESPSGVTSDDKVLVARANDGNREAFAELLQRHYDFIFRTAFKWCGHQSDAEDVTQEVCLKLAGALKSFDGRSAFTSWLYRITLNAVRDMQRSRSRRVKRHVAYKDISGVSSPASQEEAATTAQMWRAVRQLPDKQCDAVLLVYSEELTHFEASEIMGVKESTVSGYVMEAKKTLKGLL